MRLSRRDFGLSLAAATMLSPVAAAAQSELDRQLTAYLDAEFEEELQMDPMDLTGLGRKEQYDRLTDHSDAAAAKKLAWRRQSVAEMKRRFDPAKLSHQARV